MYARNIHYADDLPRIVQDDRLIATMRGNILEGDVYIVRQAIRRDLVLKIREYLTAVGKSSIPNYLPIAEGCPNFHRINYWDERAYVKGCFHQFAFFPWNQDVFNLFELARPVYALKNRLSNLPAEKFYARKPEDGCVARIAFQFYPKGTGGLNKHQDPVDHHQLSVPILTMSTKGKDFQTGGCFVEKASGEKIYVDEISEIGDAVYFNAVTPHGVEKIDADAEPDWVSFEGRWMMLFATNKLSGNTAIANARDLETGKAAARAS
jgi:hypothetical protein